jgi:elongator complex protein 1
MRRQRIDTNLIVDYDPEAFLENGGAEVFIGQINKIDNINLFLSSLIDVDTTLWKYPVPNWLRRDNEPRALPQSIEVEAKVNRVCVKMREVMLHAEDNGATESGKIVSEGHFLLPVLSTFAKEVPARLEEALSRIKSSASQAPQKQRKKTSILLSEHVQSSIQYLAFLADYEILFNTAIGMYDWDLAKAVARHSQMDPKVYLPMLKRWRDELPESTARFEVDVKLKRYESALRHLVSSSESKEPDDHLENCLKFIEEHKLHSLGLELFAHDSNFTCTIMSSLGESLLVERKFDDALTVFLSSEPKNFDGAKRAAKASGDWKTYFSCCGELGESIDSEQVTAIAESISSKMTTPKQQQESYAAAARILLDYGQDVAYAMDMLISGHMWFEGRRIAHLHSRPDLAKKCVDAASTYANTCIEDLSERASTFETTNDKYAEVIVLRRDAIKEAEETGVELHDDSASLFSMQSTASNSSLRSTASSSSIGSLGSVASVSTVISVGTKTGFQFTGDRDTTFKHKSKFNKIGRDQKKKKKQKKKGPAARRMKPGSEEHLKELVMTLTTTCPDEHYLGNISETINFLLQSGKRSLARLLFEAYHDIETAVTKSQTSRLEADRAARREKERLARKEGLIYENTEHHCEKEVNAVHCKSLPTSIENVMSYLST